MADDVPPLMALGRHLARECTSCHRQNSVTEAIPAITGRSIAEFLATIREYQTGTRTNPVMVSVAKSLDEHQLAALAAYLATLPKPQRTRP